jgi:hypothetical protein
MEDKNMRDYLKTLTCILIMMFVIVYFGSLIYLAFQPHEQDVYKFEVTGIINTTNATTVASLHFECIKYCGEHIQNYYMNDCFDACQTLGKELE